MASVTQQQSPSVLSNSCNLSDLINYEPLKSDDELINEVLDYLISPEIASRGYVPLKDNVWSEDYAGARISLIQQALLIPKGRVISMRYVFSDESITDKKILNNLLGKVNDSWPVYVERASIDANTRLGWLRKHFQRKAFGFIVQSGDQMESHFNIVIYPHSIIESMSHYGFSEERFKELRVVYSLFSELLPGNQLFFQNGSLINESVSFSFDFKNESSNIVINPEVSEGVDSVIYVDPEAGNKSLIDLRVKSSELNCLKKYLS